MPPILLLAALALLFGCKEENKLAATEAEAAKTAESEPEFKKEIGSMTDTRDGKTYKTTKIGEQVWMAENLQFSAEGSKCYADKPEYCNKYGRLYDWETAMKVCPKGWHLPDTAEWKVLFDFAGGEKAGGKKLKAKSGWNGYKGKSGNGTDDYGFAALPGGIGDSDGFGIVTLFGYWWSATEENTNIAYSRYMSHNSENTYWDGGFKTQHLLSVRCVRD